MLFKKLDILTIGGATRDIIFYTSEALILKNKKDSRREKLVCFEHGAKINISSADFFTGGGAANAAISLARLGLKVGAVIRVGNDKEGQEIARDFKKEGVSSALMQIDPRLATGFSFIAIARKGRKRPDRVAFLFRGANDNLAVDQKKIKNFKAKWFYVSSLPDNSWQLILQTVIGLEKTKIAWNPGILQIRAGQRVLADFLQITEVLILNKDEAIELALASGELPGKAKSTENDLLKIIFKTGPKIVAITSGKEGAYVYDGTNVYYQKARPVKVVDPTGAGDAFGSTFIAGLEIYNYDLKRALGIALANSVSVVTKVGAQAGLLTIKEIEGKEIRN